MQSLYLFKLKSVVSTRNKMASGILASRCTGHALSGGDTMRVLAEKIEIISCFCHHANLPSFPCPSNRDPQYAFEYGEYGPCWWRSKPQFAMEYMMQSLKETPDNAFHCHHHVTAAKASMSHKHLVLRKSMTQTAILQNLTTNGKINRLQLEQKLRFLLVELLTPSSGL